MKTKLIILFIGLQLYLNAEDTLRYTGKTLVNVDYHHGQLSPAIGVHNIQIFRANREYPETADSLGWTYNHAPMLAYWNNTFFVEYLSNPIGEHVPPGQTLLLTSTDGYKWSKPVVLFPKYKVPDGTTKANQPGKVAKDLYAVMHQRMGFYLSKNNRLLAIAYYGIALDAKDDPNDGQGIGRVVREVFENGSFGQIYFIRNNKSFDISKAEFPLYTTSSDKGFVDACNELLAKPLMMQQWNEEADRDDPLIPLKKEFKAFCFYHLPDKRVVGLWKNALTSISNDEGRTWQYNPTRAPKFVNSNAKIWGQRTSDGRYVTVYNPSEFRWPLALSVSNDGLNYSNLLLVQGEIPPMRYGGNYKSYGPQYVRGILEGNGAPPDSDLWVTYSMNKEDIWVASIPVPIKDKCEKQVSDIFDQIKTGEELKYWNIYSPQWAPVKIEKLNENTKALALTDWDKFDYAKAERIFPESNKMSVEFVVVPAQNNKGQLQIELQDSKGTAALRMIFGPDSSIKVKSGARFSNMMKYKVGEEYKISIDVNTELRFYKTIVNGKEMPVRLLFAPVVSLERIVFRTGEPRHFPTPDTPADQTYDLQDAGEKEPLAAFYIKSFKFSSDK